MLHVIETVVAGGGLSVDYSSDAESDFHAYSDALHKACSKLFTSSSRTIITGLWNSYCCFIYYSAILRAFLQNLESHW